MQTSPDHIYKKSAAWHKHGKHSKVDPVLIRDERRRRPRTEQMFNSVAEAFAAARRGRRSA